MVWFGVTARRRASTIACSAFLVCAVAPAVRVAADPPPPSGPGALDPSFGGGSVALGSYRPVGSQSLAIQPDGKIVVAAMPTSGGTPKVQLIRLTTTGAIDTTFGPRKKGNAGEPGKIFTNIGTGSSSDGAAVALLPSGEILIAGSHTTGTANSATAAAIERWRTDGTQSASVDYPRGSGPWWPTTNTSSGSDDHAVGVAVLPDGNVAVLAQEGKDGGADFGLLVVGPTLTTKVASRYVDFHGGDDIPSSLAVSGGKLVMTGTTRNGTDTLIGLARTDLAAVPDATFGSGGRVELNPTAGGFDEGRAVVVDAQGRPVVVGATGSPARPVAARLTTSGALDPAYGIVSHRYTSAGADAAGARALVVDGSGRTLDVGYVGTDNIAAARLVADPGGAADPLDHSFGALSGTTRTGHETYDCPEQSAQQPSGGVSVLLDKNGRAVVAGSCGATLRVLRLLGDPISNLTLTVDRASTPAGQQTTPLAGLAPAALASAQGVSFAGSLQSSTVQSAPAYANPAYANPAYANPAYANPAYANPVAGSVFATNPILRAVPVAGLTLYKTPGWEARTAGTALAGRPVVTLTLGDFIDAGLVNDLTLADIDLTTTPFARVSRLGLLLLGVPLSRVCARLTTTPAYCQSPTGTVADLEVAGTDTSAITGQPLSLKGLDFAGAPLDTVPVTWTNLRRTPLGGLSTTGAGMAPFVRCNTGQATCKTMQDAEDAGGLDETKRLGDLIRAALGNNLLADLSLAAVLPGLIAGGELPIEYADRDAILASAEYRAAATEPTFTLSVTVDCAQFDRTAFSASILTAPGFRAHPGTSRLTVRKSDGTTTAPAGIADPTGSPRAWTGAALPGLCNGDSGIQVATISATYNPPVVLGPTTADAVVSARGTTLRVEDTAAVLVVDANEPTDSSPGSPTAATLDVVRSGHISKRGDVDWYEITIPAGTPAGAELTVTGFNLPRDYDIALFGPGSGLPVSPTRPQTFVSILDDTSTGFASDPGVASPETANDTVQVAPAYANPAYANPAYANPAYANPAYANPAYANPAYANPAYANPAYANPAYANSINRGRSVESVTFRLGEGMGGKKYTVGISGYNGSYDVQPYLWVARLSGGPTPPACVSPLTFAGDAASAWPASIPSDTKTLIVLARSRTAGIDMAQLAAFAARPDVKGLILPMDNVPNPNGDPNLDVKGALAQFDANPCSVTAANLAVSRMINAIDLVRPQLPQLRYLTILGDGTAIPQARLIDPLGAFGENTQALNVLTAGKHNPTSAAYAQNYFLSDDPFGAFLPAHYYKGDALHVPNVAVARVPAAINQVIGRYIASNGVIDPQQAFIAGYEFLTDAAQTIAANLQLPSTTVRTDGWTGADAKAGIDGGAGGVTSVNGHYDATRLQPASGPGDTISTADLAAANAATVFMTVGCHAGELRPGLKTWAVWAQEAGAASAVLNTGYGYAESDTLAYSEQLLAAMASHLAGRKVTIGQALMLAKQQLYRDVRPFDVYTAKSMEESTFYGLPMYRLGANGGEAAPTLPKTIEAPATVTTTGAPVSYPDPVFGAPVAATRGTIVPVQGGVPQASPGRGIVYNRTVDVTVPGRIAHGVTIDGLTSTDTRNLDASISEPLVDSRALQPERSVTEMVYPTQIAAVQHGFGPSGPVDQVVKATEQWFIDANTDPGRANLRKFTHAEMTVWYSNSTDFVAPSIVAVTGGMVGPTGYVSVHTLDSDVVDGIVLYRFDTDTTNSPWRVMHLAKAADGIWSTGITVPAGATTFEATVQLRDSAGNVGWSSFKTTGHRFGQLDPGNTPRLAASPSAPASGYYTGPAPQITLLDMTPGATYSISIDGESYGVYSGPFSAPSTEGIHTVTFVGTDGATGAIVVAIEQSAPTIQALVSPAPNADGWNRGTVTVHFTCADAVAGVASCSPDVVVSADTAGQTVTGTAVDREGKATSISVLIKKDGAAPTISAALVPAPNANGWNNTDVTVDFTCADALSGVASCTPDELVTTEGAGRQVSGTVTDRAGNSASITTSVNIDKTKPTITATPNANTWNRATVTVTFACSDALSGVASCPAPKVYGTEGTFTDVFTATDRAGNTQSVEVVVKIDFTAPTITSVFSPAPNAAGWNNQTSVLVDFTCTDAASGVATCPADRTLTAEGVHTISGSASDVAGNTSSITVTVRIDRAKPTTTICCGLLLLGQQVTGTATDPTSGGVFSGMKSVTVVFQPSGGGTATTRTYQCAGQQTCAWSAAPPPGIVSFSSVTATPTDVAGNVGTAAVLRNVSIL